MGRDSRTASGEEELAILQQTVLKGAVAMVAPEEAQECDEDHVFMVNGWGLCML
jgi:tellurite resistance-related uncharacterized protein